MVCNLVTLNITPLAGCTANCIAQPFLPSSILSDFHSMYQYVLAVIVTHGSALHVGMAQKKMEGWQHVVGNVIIICTEANSTLVAAYLLNQQPVTCVVRLLFFLLLSSLVLIFFSLSSEPTCTFCGCRVSLFTIACYCSRTYIKLVEF